MVPALTSPALERAGFRHAFFLRQGGVSGPPYATLNFSTAGGDDPGAVAENLRRAAARLGVSPEQLYYLSQVHGTSHRVLTGRESRDVLLHEPGDITLSRDPQVACGVRMADCAAVLLGDRTSGAAAAIHSGWRGTVANAVGAGVEALRSLLGGAELDLVAAVGPHIEACCFEVGADVAEQIAAAAPEAANVVSWPNGEGQRPHVDLRQVLAAQLARAGVGQVEMVAGCTVCDAERFHSYRRDGKRSGRMMAAIVPATGG